MNKQVILCVDDEEIILEALQEQLYSTFGNEYTIETSDSGEDALEFFNELIEEEINVPVVISDYIMPGMKGDDLLKEIHKVCPGSLKILLTGQASIEGISNAINNAELYRYIAKPWDKDDLVLTVKEAIRSYFQELQIKKQNEELAKLNESLEQKVILRTKELEKANASKDKFFSIIAHDLKNPFSALMGISDLLLTNWDDMREEDKKEFVSDIYTSSENTFKLLQNLLEWSRSQTGKMKVNPTETYPSHIVDKNIEVLKQHADNKGIAIENNIPSLLSFVTDENMFSTIVRNLISNAVKFSNSGGQISINYSEEDKKHKIFIKDNGIGMDEATVEKIFDTSEKIQRTGTNNEVGTGLGLILCKEFVEKNGGKIQVESTPGKGSTFCISLPV